MKLIIAGTGAGDGSFLTVRALDWMHKAEVIVVPRSHGLLQGMAEKIIKRRVPGRKYISITFPMTSSASRRDNAIFTQLSATRNDWEGAELIFFPVIGDAMLYSTGDYLLNAWRKIVPDIEAEFIPGVSAHSLAAACAKKFLVMRDEVFTIIPGTAKREKIKRALSASDCAAIYKPTVVKDLKELAEGFSDFIRVDYAGIPELEEVTRGPAALDNITEYMSVILLWRN